MHISANDSTTLPSTADKDSLVDQYGALRQDLHEQIFPPSPSANPHKSVPERFNSLKWNKKAQVAFGASGAFLEESCYQVDMVQKGVGRFEHNVGRSAVNFVMTPINVVIYATDRKIHPLEAAKDAAKLAVIAAFAVSDANHKIDHAKAYTEEAKHGKRDLVQDARTLGAATLHAAQSTWQNFDSLSTDKKAEQGLGVAAAWAPLGKEIQWGKVANCLKAAETVKTVATAAEKTQQSASRWEGINAKFGELSKRMRQTIEKYKTTEIKAIKVEGPQPKDGTVYEGI